MLAERCTNQNGSRLYIYMQNPSDLTDTIVLLAFARSATLQGHFHEARMLLDDAAAQPIPATVAKLISAAIRELDSVLAQ